MSSDLFGSLTTFECVPKHAHLPRSAQRAQVLAAALELLALGQRVSVQRLREHGVRGGTARLIEIRDKLIAAGKLPPEASARFYTRCLHPHGKASNSCELRVASCSNSCELRDPSGARSGEKIESSSLATRHSPLATTEPRTPIKRWIVRYELAVARVFGPCRAKQIGATRLRLRHRHRQKIGAAP